MTDHGAAVRRLTLILAVAIPVSVVHYADNYFNYDAYPLSDTIPNPSAWLVGLSWFLFTAAGVTGYILFRRSPSPRALVLLALYSGSGLVGFLHYSVPGATGMPWWRQAHIVSDILCGLAVFAFALRAARAGPAEARAAGGASA